MNAVDPDAPWIKVRRCIAARPMQYHGPGMIRVADAMTQHPTIRRYVKGLDVVNLMSLEDLPEWLRGRLAVLNIADAGTWIRGIGKRWSLVEHAQARTWVANTIGRYYTIELNCEECL